MSLNLGDKRLDKRLKKIVSVMTKQGGTSLPDRFGNWSGHIVFSNPKVSYDKIISPHCLSLHWLLECLRLVNLLHERFVLIT